MKRKTIFNTLILALMVFSSLFVANMSPYVSVSAIDHPVSVYKVSGNIYKDADGNKYYKQMVGLTDQAVETSDCKYTDFIDMFVKTINANYWNSDTGPYASSYGQYVNVMIKSGGMLTQATDYYMNNGIYGKKLYTTNYMYKYQYFRYDPIMWQVVAYNPKTNQALLVSDQILANMAFQPTGTIADSSSTIMLTTANGGGSVNKTHASNYAYSNIRYWLNGYTQTGQTQINNWDISSDGELKYLSYYNISSVTDSTLGYPSFVNTAFTASEKSKLQTVNIYGDVVSLFDLFTLRNDGTFLSEFVEIDNGVTWSIFRNYIKYTPKIPTDFALSHYAAQDSEGTSYGAWLATQIEGSGIGTDIEGGGGLAMNAYGNVEDIALSYSALLVDWIHGGVAPAIIVDATDMMYYIKYSKNDKYELGGLISDIGDKVSNVLLGAEWNYYVSFGSYPQTLIEATETISIPAAGVGINTAGIVLSSTILIGLFIWMGFIAKNTIKSKKTR